MLTFGAHPILSLVLAFVAPLSSTVLTFGVHPIELYVPRCRHVGADFRMCAQFVYRTRAMQHTSRSVQKWGTLVHGDARPPRAPIWPGTRLVSILFSQVTKLTHFARETRDKAMPKAAMLPADSFLESFHKQVGHHTTPERAQPQPHSTPPHPALLHPFPPTHTQPLPPTAAYCHLLQTRDRHTSEPAPRDREIRSEAANR